MTIDEFNKIPLHFAYHISMSEWNELCYVSEDNFFGVQRITDKDEDTGEFGKTRIHYRIGGKWYKSKKKILGSIGEVMNHCRYYLPWITTSQGEIMDVCVDDDRRTIKRCNPEECMLHGENFGQEEEDLEYEAH